MQSFCEATDLGLNRDNNEDAILSEPALGLWLVADGMGGHAAGEVASELTKTIVRESIKKGLSLSDAIHSAHRSIIDATQTDSSKRGMGSTVVALQTLKTQFHIAWVGDSRAYLWRLGEDGDASFSQLTTDHSYVQMLFQSGAISAEEMTHHPEKNIITQCLGSTELETVDVDELSQPWQTGDKILLCSDGLTDVVSDQAICDILFENKQSDQAVPKLVQRALENRARDNISVILVDAPTEESGLNMLWQTLRTRLKR